MTKQISVCGFCAKRGRMRHDGFCSAECALNARIKKGENGFTSQSEIRRMIWLGEQRRKKGKK
jgi:hypothetical protein